MQCFLIWILLNLIFAKQNYKKLDLTTSIKENELNKLYFNDKSTKKICDYWIPALFNPVLLVDFNAIFEIESFASFYFKSLIFLTDELLDVALYDYSFFDDYTLIYGKNNFNGDIINQCYFGLSKGLAGYEIITENQINLNILKDQKYIDEKIFSFDKWTINERKDEINSFLYLGDIHENFLSKNGTIGTCNAKEKDSYWGCTFKEMKFNDNIISLMNDTNKGTYYQIYFYSEDHLIIFPKSFEKEFNKMTNNICEEDKDSKFLICENLFNSENYIPMKLIDDNMIITIEVDNSNRFTSNKSPEHKTRIKFEDNEFFIFPLIMFKNFHVQFNLNDNKISFYTNNKTILELKGEEDNSNSKEQEENGSSNSLKIFLIIFIILLILVLGFGIFWFVKKRRSKDEKNINKYNKFEEDEAFQNMDEKRVF